MRFHLVLWERLPYSVENYIYSLTHAFTSYMRHKLQPLDHTTIEYYLFTFKRLERFSMSMSGPWAILTSRYTSRSKSTLNFETILAIMKTSCVQKLKLVCSIFISFCHKQHSRYKYYLIRLYLQLLMTKWKHIFIL